MDTRPNAISRYPDPGAWAEMLARVWDKNARLGDAVARNWPRRGGANLLTELERERSRIARELHAGAGQPLAGIKLHLELLEATRTGRRPRRGPRFGRLQTLADQALSQVRAVSHRLHPPEWQEMTSGPGDGVAGGIERARQQAAVDAGFPTFNGGAVARREGANVPVRAGVHLQHHPAFGCDRGKPVSCGRARKAGPYCSDNGHGFDTGAKNSGIGLRAIAENAASIGGKSSITSSPEGTRIVVILPLSAD